MSTNKERLPLLTLAILFVGYACSYFHRADLPALAPVWANNGNHPDLAAALPDIASLGMLVYALGKFAGGMLAHHFGGRRLFVFALAGAAIAEFVAATCTTPTAFAATRVAGMAVLALAWPALGQIVSSLTPRRRLATVMAFFSQSYLLGDAAVRAVLAAVVANGGGSTTILRTSGTVLAVAAAAVAAVFAFTWHSQREHLRATASATTNVPPTNKLPLVWLAGMNAALGMSREALSFWSPLLLVEWCSLPADDAVRATALLPLASGVGALLSGLLADRGPRLLALVTLLPIVVGALLLLLLTTTHELIPLLLLLAGVCTFTAMPQSLASGVLPLRAGASGGARRLGFVDGVGTLGSVLAAGGVARMRDAWGMNTAIVVLAAVLGVAAIGAAGFLVTTRRASLREA